MAKKNDGGNNKVPLKNQELLNGQRDNRTPQQQAAAGKNPNVKKDNEKWEQLAERTTKEKQPFREKVQEYHTPTPERSRNEPEKDKE